MIIMAKRKRMIKTSVIACSTRRKQKKYIPYLPKEIIFNILSWLPAEFLHNKAKHVCKTWADIIRDRIFIRTHLLHSNAGLFIQSRYKYYNDARYLEIKGGKLRITHLKCPFPGKMLASCEGISLFLLKVPHAMLYVANMVTMQVVKLPCPAIRESFLKGSVTLSHTIRESFITCSGITRISHTGDFKVIYPYVGLDGLCHWFVLTVGTDMSWRKIDGKLLEKDFEFNLYSISIGGIIYWVTQHVTHRRSILAVDLHDETSHSIRVPKFVRSGHELRKMDNYLSCFVHNDLGDVDIWILKDLHTGKWAKVRNFESAAARRNHISVLDCLNHPFAWLDNGQILMLYSIKVLRKNGKGVIESTIEAYNVKRGVRRTIENVRPYNSHVVLEHTNSLVSW